MQFIDKIYLECILTKIKTSLKKLFSNMQDKNTYQLKGNHC